MSEQENTKVVQGVYEAFGRGDIPAVIGAFADDGEIQFYGPSEIPMAGTHRGHEAIGKFFQIVGGAVDIQEFAPDDIVAQGEAVVVLGHEKVSAKTTGKSWSTTWAMVWTVRNGRIALLREFHNTAEIAAAFRP